MKRANSPATTDNVRRADRVLSFRGSRDLTFSNVDRALAWYFPARERMQCPQSPRPRGEEHRGEIVIVDVDGGTGGDVDEVLSTVSTVGDALHELQVREPQAHYIVAQLATTNTSERELASRLELSRGQVGKLRARGESLLAGMLIARGVIR